MEVIYSLRATWYLMTRIPVPVHNLGVGDG